jgi:hypothetical protein
LNGNREGRMEAIEKEMEAVALFISDKIMCEKLDYELKEKALNKKVEYVKKLLNDTEERWQEIIKDLSEREHITIRLALDEGRLEGLQTAKKIILNNLS